MLFHYEFPQNEGIYELHKDVLDFFRNSVNASHYTDGLFSEPLKNVIAGSNLLDEKFRGVFDELSKDRIEKQLVFDFLNHNNEVIQIVQNANFDLATLPKEYNAVVMAIANLYKFLWHSTIKTDVCAANYSSLSVHYKNHDALNYARTRRVCAFCGLRKLENPKEKRNEYDHYLDKDTYPYLAVNFVNLVPMCDQCNKRPNKGSKSMIMDDNGVRRAAYYPYLPVDAFTVTMSCTDLFMPNATWTIEAKTNNDVVGFKTWKSVFNIETRFTNYIEDTYLFWLNSFAVFHKENLPNSLEDLKDKVSTYLNSAILAFAGLEEGYFLHRSFWDYFITIPDSDLTLLIQLMEEREIYKSPN